MNFCDQCGQPVRTDARFCGACGANLVEDVAPVRAQSLAPPAAAAVATPAPVTAAASDPGVQAVASGSRRRRVVPLAIGAIGLVAVGLVAYRFVGSASADGGASSPEAAVSGLVQAASDEDVLRIIELIAPAEVEQAGQIIERLGEVSADGGLDTAPLDLAGIDLELDATVGEAEELSDDVAYVPVDRLRITASVDPAQASPEVQALVARELGPTSAQSWSREVTRPAELFVSDDELEYLDDYASRLPGFLLTVRDGGRWYVSPSYTAMEYLRQGLDLAPARFGSTSDQEDLGAETPEAVVEGLAMAASRWDVGGVIDLLDPEAMAAVHDYRNALVSLVVDDSGLLPTLTVDNIEAKVVERSGNRARVAVEDASGQLYWYDDWEGGQQLSFDADGSCATVSVSDGSGGSGCLDSPEVLDWFFNASLLGYGEDFRRDSLVRWVASSVDEPTVEVVERDGRWFLSPVGTMTNLLEGPAEDLDVQTLAFLSGLEHVIVEPSGTLELGVPATVSFAEGELVKVLEVELLARSDEPLACLSIDRQYVGTARVHRSDGDAPGRVVIYNTEALDQRGLVPSYGSPMPGELEVVVHYPYGGCS